MREKKKKVGFGIELKINFHRGAYLSKETSKDKRARNWHKEIDEKKGKGKGERNYPTQRVSLL